MNALPEISDSESEYLNVFEAVKNLECDTVYYFLISVAALHFRKIKGTNN